MITNPHSKSTRGRLRELISAELAAQQPIRCRLEAELDAEKTRHRKSVGEICDRYQAELDSAAQPFEAEIKQLMKAIVNPKEVGS